MTNQLHTPKVAGPLTVVVVDAIVTDAMAAVTALTAAGFHVTVADNFEAAKQHMARNPPSVLIADVFLGEFNGLHLVIRGKALRPELAAIVTCDRPDPVLAMEASRLGATFVVKPLAPEGLLGAIYRTLFRREGDSAPIEPPYERRMAERRMAMTTFSHPERRQLERRRDLSGFVQAAPIQS
jgi:DNA-binding NtrC family response regulator